MANLVQISHEVFGRAFLWHAVTPTVIGKQIDALPRVIRQTLGGLPLGATADIVATLGGCSVNGSPNSFFSATIQLHLDLTIHAVGFIKENYRVDTHVPLRITIETWAPGDQSWGLLVHARVDPVQPAQLPVAIQHQAGSNLAQLFGHLEQVIPQQLATAINQNLADGDKGRWVDIAKMIQTTNQH